MKIKKTWWSTEIDVTPGELVEFTHKPPRYVSNGLWRWLHKYLDFKLVFDKEANDK